MKHPKNLLPQVSFSVLFALSLQPRHGYEIMQQIKHDTGGRLQIGPGALYGSIKQLRVAGYIEELTSTDPTERRRFYKLSPVGWESLNNEITYYKETVSLARKRIVMDNK